MLRRVIASLQVQQKRTLKRWQVDTLRLMYRRSRQFDVVPHEKRPRSAFLDWNRRSELSAFKHRLHEGDLADDRLQAVFSSEEEQQRLAEVGHQLVSRFGRVYLSHFLPSLPREGISEMVAYLQQDSVLEEIARALGATDLLEDPSSLPRVPMAMIGALAEQFGDQRAEKFTADFLFSYLDTKDPLEIWEIPRPEETLSKILQNSSRGPLEARLLRETGRNTLLAAFLVGVYSDKQLLGSGAGESPSIAKEMAILDALRRMFGLTPGRFLLKFGGKERKFEHTRENASIADFLMT